MRVRARGIPGPEDGKADMDAKKGVLALIVLFLGFYMFTDPAGLASLAKEGGGEGWELTTQLFEATIKFLDELT